MLVQATQHFETIEDAQDSLTGLQNLPDFVLGYILQNHSKNSGRLHRELCR